MTTDTARELLDAMLHPVRMRVLTALAGSRGMTPLQIAAQLSDVPQATLYRHINRLAKAGLLQVAGERPVRGTTEKVYTLNPLSYAALGGEEIARLSREDHLRFFAAFMLSLQDRFARYLNHSPAADLAADGAGYTQVVLFMNDEELVEFSKAVNRALLPYQQPAEAQSGGQKQTKRILTTILIPEVSGGIK